MSATWQFYSHISGIRPGRLEFHAFPHDAPVFTLTEQKQGITVTTASGQDYTISRVRWFPRPEHVMLDASAKVWHLAVRSLLQRTHSLQLANGASWIIHTPFYSVSVRGNASDGASLAGRVGNRKTEWLFSVEPGAPSLEALTGFAFVHWRWYFGIS